MPRRRTTSVVSLVKTGYQPPTRVAALPSGANNELIKVENWGAANQLPQDLAKIVYDSGTASLCIERLTQFINGKGFASEITARRMANPEQTFNQVWAEMANYCAWDLGAAYIIRYPYGGEIEHAEIWVAAVDCLRVEKGGAGRYVINFKLADGKMPAGENRLYLPYRPLATAEEISEEVLAAVASPAGYHGHLVFNFKYRLGRTIYPIPTWAAAREDVESDAELPKFDLKQVRNSFMPDAVITLIGQKYADMDDPDWEAGEGQDEADRPTLASPDLVAFKQAVANLKGSTTTASVLINVAENEDSVPQIDWIDKGPNAKGLTDMTNRIEGKVYRRFGVPPVLCGVAEAGMLGSNQQIINSILLFGLTVIPAREIGLAPLRQMFPGLDFSVIPLDPIDYIDPAVAAEMTSAELRALRGLKGSKTEAEAAEKAAAEQPAPAPKPTPKPKPATESEPTPRPRPRSTSNAAA